MSAFFTTPFSRSFPDFIDEHHDQYDLPITLLMRSISNGYFQVFVEKKTWIEILKDLKKKEHRYYNRLIALTGSSKIVPTASIENISEVSSEVIGLNIPHEIIRAIALKKDTVFHDKLNNKSQQDKISRYYQKPIFLKEDLLKKDMEFLFDNKDFTRDIGQNFNWEDFLKPYVLPFKTIRLIDPYLYLNSNNKKININHKFLPSIIEPLIVESGKDVCIQIISNLTPRDTKWTHDQLKEKVINNLTKVNNFKGKIELYSQKSSESKIFHRRGIWTDFWYLRLDRGFDIINEAEILKYECDFSLIGKYSSDFSTWYQVKNNWENYRSSCHLFSSD